MGLISRRIIPALGMALACLGSLAAAADVDFPSPDMRVTPGSTTTYLDLARHFVPDIKAGDNGYAGQQIIPLRHIAGGKFANDGATSFGFYDISTVRMQAEGKERLLVLFDFAQAAKSPEGVAVLALYDLSGEPILLDAADIGFDESTYFFDQALLPIAEGTDAILTMSSHFNSNQTYTTQAIMMVRKDRLEFIDRALLLDERACGYERRQTIRYAANPNAGKPFAPITVIVNDGIDTTIEDCGDGAQASSGEREVKTVYRWQTASGHYVPDSDGLVNLARENESRF